MHGMIMLPEICSLKEAFFINERLSGIARPVPPVHFLLYRYRLRNAL